MGQADLPRSIGEEKEPTALTNLGWGKGPAVTILAKLENDLVEGARYEAIGSLRE